MYCSQCGKEIPPDSTVCPSCQQAAQPESVPETKLPKESERYKIISRIGKVGMGQVDKAKDIRLNRIVALKRLNPDIQSDYASIQRFLREAKSIANLNHPNIVQVYDINQDKQGYYISMEFIEGKTLAQRLARKGRIPLKKAIDLILIIAGALKFAHEKGIIHRDIKPSNIFITKDENIKIMDFGLVRTQGLKSEEITRHKTPMGTPAYMSPEQKKDTHNVDERTDIYSLGLVLCEMLLGKLPRLIKIEALPPVIQRIINRSLEENVTRRYNNISLLIAELEEIKQSIEFTPEMIKRTNEKPLIPRIILLILLLITTAFFTWRQHSDKISLFFQKTISILPGQMELNGIIYQRDTDKASVAIINQQHLKVDEMINGYRVFKIEKDSVTLTKGGKKFILHFN
jgi:serine/threonine protein kinase